MFGRSRRDAQAFEQLCAPYSAMVYRHCLHMLHNPHEAEDAAQESMLRAYRAFGSFQGGGVATWLYRIAHNTCLDILKSARWQREKASLDADGSALDPVAPSLTPEEVYVMDAQSRQLWDIVATLPEEQQTLLSLYYGDGMRYEDIAKATGQRVGTVKSRLSRARDALRKKFDEI